MIEKQINYICKYKKHLFLVLSAFLCFFSLSVSYIKYRYSFAITICQFVEIFIDLINVYLVIRIYNQNQSKAPTIFLMLSIVLLLVLDLVYFLVYSIPHQIKYIFVFDTMHFLYYMMTITFIFFLIFKHTLNLRKLTSILPLIIMVDVGIFIVFSIDPHYLSDHISLRNNIQIFQSSMDLILFSLAFLWLVYSRSVGSMLLATGYIICTSSEFMLTSCYMTNMTFLLGYAELLWLLGLIFIMTGMIFIIINKQFSLDKWMAFGTTMATSLILSIFSVVFASTAIFFIILKEFSVINENFYIFFPTIFMIYSVIIALASLMLSKIIEKPIIQIQKDIENTIKSDHKDFTIDNPKSYSEIHSIENHIKKLILYVDEQSRDAAVGNVAKQVAHDIRSPLSAMHTFVELLDSQLTEKDRIFLRNAIRRIDDIASNLVSCYKGNEYSHCENAFLACCILEILAEKRREYFNVQNIFFEFEVEKKKIILQLQISILLNSKECYQIL